MKYKKNIKNLCNSSGRCAGISITSRAQKYIHPGINQTAEDLGFMKMQVKSGAQPWKDAFDRLVSATDLNAEIKPFNHVQRGPYGRPNIGGGELDKNSNMAYDCALIWYITRNKAYAARISVSDNIYAGNGNSPEQEKISKEKYIVMQ